MMFLVAMWLQEKAMGPLRYDTIWPVSLSGWVTMLAAALALGNSLQVKVKSQGKQEQLQADTLEKINGLGTRVNNVESEQDRIRGQHDELVRLVDRVTETQRHLIEKVTESKQASESCDERTDQFAREIGSKVDELRRAVSDEGRKTGERLKEVEIRLGYLTPKRDA